MFVIDLKTLNVRAAATQAEAAKFGNGGTFLASEDAMAANKDFTGTVLVDLYNKFAEVPVKKFSDRATAVRRTWNAIGANVTPAAPVPAAEPVAAVNPAPAPAEKPKTNRGRKAGTGEFAGKTFRALKQVNPRRIGTHGFRSYEILREKPEGVLYADYIAAGGRPNDLRWDLDHKNAEEVKG